MSTSTPKRRPIVKKSAKPAEDGDARFLRSRAMLHRAFLDLLELHPFDQISIRMIADRAGVGSSTYYRHYPGKEALLEDVAAREIEKLAEEVALIHDRANSLKACIALCEHIDAHRRAWSSLLMGGAAEAVRQRLMQVGKTVAPTRPRDNGLPSELGLAVITGAMVELLRWWLAQWNPPSAKTVGFILSEIAVRPAESFAMTLAEIQKATGEIE
jgi:AcrR family transcriptional regulator